MKFRRGAGDTGAGSIAVLISLIALFIILYVLLLPQQARRELLGDESGIGGREIGEGGDIYFSRYLGELSPSTRDNRVYHNVPAVNLFTTSEKDLSSISSYLQVSSGFVSSKGQNIIFNLANPENVNKAVLYLFIEEAEGDLILRLNGHEVYNNELRANVQESVELPLSYLQEANNLEVAVSSSSWMFWKTNKYKIRYIKLRKVTEILNKVVERTIAIPSSEWGSIESGVLRYSVFCDRREDSVLKIFVNDQLVHGDVPFCNIEADEIEISKRSLVAGTNNIRFETLDGDYLIEEISLRTLLQRETGPEEIFSINEEYYKEIRKGLNDIIAYFYFGKIGDKRVFSVYVNGEEIDVDTEEDIYSLVISDYVKKGGNSIVIKPRNTFELIEFSVELV